MKFTIAYGSETFPFERPMAPSFGELKADANIKMMVGFGDNIRMLVNGVEMPDNARVPNDAYISVETKANSKA